MKTAHGRNGEFMKRFTKLLILALSFFVLSAALSACAPKKSSDWRPNELDVDVSSDSLYVSRVENLPEDFILGMDASCVPSLEAGGVKYYDHDGNEKDVYQILAENGINYIRVRIWNDPFDADGNGYGGGNCDIDNAVEIGKRAHSQTVPSHIPLLACIKQSRVCCRF